jgi:hypothetical protein
MSDERERMKEAAIDYLPVQGLTRNWAIVEVLMENDMKNDN